MHSDATSSQHPIHLDSSGSDDDTDTDTDPSQPWLAEFNMYFRTHEVVPEGMSVITWWGVSVQSS